MEFNRPLPPEKISALVGVAQKYIAEGINTPEAFAARLASIADGKLIPFLQALWGAFIIFQPSVNATPDWKEIYAKPAPEVQQETTATSPKPPPNTQTLSLAWQRREQAAHLLQTTPGLAEALIQIYVSSNSGENSNELPTNEELEEMLLSQSVPLQPISFGED